jgi:Rrf2 family protein
MLSTTCKYAVRAIIYIGLKGSEQSRVNVRHIAAELEIPMQFLSKILQVFVRKGLLNSVKGPTGGFYLKKPADEIYLLEIVKIVDGEDYFETCLIGRHPCKSSGKVKEQCPVHERYSKVRKEVVEYFSSESIGSILERMEHSEDVLLKL